ncbi:hypothetical protein HMPREF3213_00107 [Heyndrickxia coagulans]|uniref:Uncharacterized protein n=1 Tax=Heyndrickxia coagulans TaxID=1398 RepID=A0A133L335_HEYCO|nr:hypothetical protein HMPREF3213_00107 [Heyndrickxia coagulans]
MKSLHSKVNSSYGEDKINNFRKKILLYFETEFADKLKIGFVQQALNNCPKSCGIISGHLQLFLGSEGNLSFKICFLQCIEESQLFCYLKRMTDKLKSDL